MADSPLPHLGRESGMETNVAVDMSTTDILAAVVYYSVHSYIMF